MHRTSIVYWFWFLFDWWFCFLCEMMCLFCLPSSSRSSTWNIFRLNKTRWSVELLIHATCSSMHTSNSRMMYVGLCTSPISDRTRTKIPRFSGLGTGPELFRSISVRALKFLSGSDLDRNGPDFSLLFYFFCDFHNQFEINENKHSRIKSKVTSHSQSKHPQIGKMSI